MENTFNKDVNISNQKLRITSHFVQQEQNSDLVDALEHITIHNSAGESIDIHQDKINELVKRLERYI